MVSTEYDKLHLFWQKPVQTNIIFEPKNHSLQQCPLSASLDSVWGAVERPEAMGVLLELSRARVPSFNLRLLDPTAATLGYLQDLLLRGPPENRG